MNRNKGFTLIELLAVIVILAIIALIATPIVLGIINDSKESSRKISASYIVNAVEQSYSMTYALSGGMVPTIAEVQKRFKMDSAEWVGDEIRTLDGEVRCQVHKNSNEFSVKCPDLDTESMTMEISS